MLLARRAKGLGAEASDMSADSRPEDVRGMLQRSGKLRDDLEDQKGVEGMRVGTDISYHHSRDHY